MEVVSSSVFSQSLALGNCTGWPELRAWAQVADSKALKDRTDSKETDWARATARDAVVDAGVAARAVPVVVPKQGKRLAVVLAVHRSSLLELALE